MITGVGIDIIEVDRVMDKIGKENGFREKIFSKAEIAYCDSKPNKGEHYAARFAAKEAFLKATGFGLTLGYTLADVEVVQNSDGKPLLNLKGDFKTKAIEHNWTKIHLSISHLQAIACAVVIIEQ